MLRISLLPIITLILGAFWTIDNFAYKPGIAVYPEHLPGGFTGGFGEETCHTCHFDYPMNPRDGSLAIKGLPEQYMPNRKYAIVVSVSRKNLGQAGFQLSSRFEDGGQAGSLKPDSDRIAFTKASNDIEYLQHSLSGSKVNNQPFAEWNITWIAPDSGKVIINIAANAANGDASAFGDYIYIRQIEITRSEN